MDYAKYVFYPIVDPKTTNTRCKVVFDSHSQTKQFQVPPLSSLPDFINKTHMQWFYFKKLNKRIVFI